VKESVETPMPSEDLSQTVHGSNRRTDAWKKSLHGKPYQQFYWLILPNPGAYYYNATKCSINR